MSDEPIMLAEVETTIVYEFSDLDDDDRRRGGGGVWFGPSWSSGTDSGVVTRGGGSSGGSTDMAPGSTESPPPSTRTGPVDTAPTDTSTTDASTTDTPTEPTPTDTAPVNTAPVNTAPGTDAAGPGTPTQPPPPTTRGPAHPVTVPSSPVTKIWTTPAKNEAERALLDRLKVGDGTPAEALKWFQTHGYPHLAGLPTWSRDRRLWFFPDLAGIGPGTAGASGTPAGALPTGVPTPGHVAAPPPGAAHGGIPAMFGGFAPGSGRPGAQPVGAHGQPGGAPGGATGGTPGGQPGGMVGSPSTQPGGLPVPPGGHTPGGRPSTGGEPELPDDNPFVIPPSHFAQNQVEGAIRDIMDTQTPQLARIVLANFLPPAYLAMVMEKYILNPLLAAPGHLYEAARREYLALQAIANGDFLQAIEQDRAAAHHLREAAMAILAVVPFGEGATATATAGERLAGTGVEYLGSQRIYTEGQRALLHQVWVTGQPVEHIFRLPGGGRTFVDGFINRTGLEVVDQVANMVLVEVKMDSRVARAVANSTPTVGLAELDPVLLNQFERYVEIGQRLGVHSVRYVVTEATPGSPVTNGFRALLRRVAPDLFDSGFVEVFSTPPPPPTFAGVSLEGVMLWR